MGGRPKSRLQSSGMVHTVWQEGQFAIAASEAAVDRLGRVTPVIVSYVLVQLNALFWLAGYVWVAPLRVSAVVPGKGVSHYVVCVRFHSN